MRTLLAGLAALALSACALLPHTEEPARLRLLSNESLRAATVLVEVVDRGTCSGVVIAPDVVMTAAHCLVEGARLKVRGIEVSGYHANDPTDIAVLSVEGIDCPCAPVALERPALDTPVKVVGYPLGFAQFLTEGRLQGTIIDPEAPPEIREHFMAFSAPIAFGNSGGPVFAWIDGEYQVIGIVSAVRAAGFSGPVWHLAIAVSTETINEFLARI